MPTIANASLDEIRAMRGSELMAQQIVQHAAVHTLEHLLAIGVSKEHVTRMLADLEIGIAVLERTAKEKGVELTWND